MKKVFIVVIVLALVAAGLLLLTQYQARGQITATLRDLETEPVRRGDIKINVGATGDVHANQTTLLSWQTSGTIGEVNFDVGDQVSTNQILASLEQTSLARHVILAQAELIDAQSALDGLLNSKTKQAQTKKAVEDAQQALEDAHNPELIQANAQGDLAAAQKTVDEAQRYVDILNTPVSQAAKDQTYSNMLLAENVLNNTHKQIERIEKKLSKDKNKYNFWESRDLYESILENLELKLIKNQRSYEDAVEKYNDLLEPPNSNDLALAETALALAQAQLAQAEREWERVQDGPSEGDIALLEAQLDDAQREWERWKDGPNSHEIAAA
jgi:HlyD family secretion protein